MAEFFRGRGGTRLVLKGPRRFRGRNLSTDIVIGASAALVEGADVLAANVAPVVPSTDFSSATTNGADVLASAVSPIVAGSVASTDGADVLAGAVAPVVGLSSATTDGADTLSGAVAPIVGLSSATTDGADVLAAQVDLVGGAIDFSADWTNGADISSAFVEPVQEGYVKVGGDDAPPTYKQRFQVQVKNKVHLFDTDEEAQAFMRTLKKPAKVKRVAHSASTEVDRAYQEMMANIAAQLSEEDDIEEILMLL